MRLPADSAAGLIGGFLERDPRVLTMIAAAIVAPVALILLAAVASERARAVTAEARRLQKLVNDLAAGGAVGGGGGVDPAGLRGEVEGASRALSALEASLEAAEERAQLARDRLESERAALEKLVSDMDASSARMTDAVATLSGAGSRAAPAAIDTFAQQIARAMATGMSDKISGYGDEPPRYEVGRAEPSLERAISDADREAPTSAPARGFDDDGFDQPAYSGERGGEIDAPRFGDGAGGGYEVERYDEDFGDDQFREAARDPAPAATASANGAIGGLDWSKLVRAANFPDSEDDRETLEALYAVLTDREAAAFLQSAEDALSALADIGLFMEDMTPTHGPVEIWRNFILDNDQRDAIELGGVRDPHAIEDVIGALGEKPDFSDTAERFLDRYETMAARLFREAPSQSMAVELADTRSGRAYMLIGRAAGRFG